MRNLKKMRDRYLRDKRPVRLGNLASSLLRLSTWVRMGHQDEAVIDLMREIAWYMEWRSGVAGTGQHAARDLPLAPYLAG
jgi:hypothetical protein